MGGGECHGPTLSMREMQRIQPRKFSQRLGGIRNLLEHSRVPLEIRECSREFEKEFESSRFVQKNLEQCRQILAEYLEYCGRDMNF